ncbi:hypothetical protein H5410_005418 [Solanum commersonii]|uniref:Reverse transcriptase domain-containing protein n=1 Tax=Solanum commersonii TaxID=4109 RepID=A0A9J6A751_SOLCO|nr:hypothetical protein H5410_005418 [Solanum commersonii]
MYDKAKTRVRIVGGDSYHFQVEMGLHQGSSLSPFLFALAIDQLTQFRLNGGIISKLEVWTPSLEFKGFTLSSTKTIFGV